MDHNVIIVKSLGNDSLHSLLFFVLRGTWQNQFVNANTSWHPVVT